MADDWHIDYDNDAGYDGGFSEWWTVSNRTTSYRADSEAEAKQLLALLRFQSAMTPEMWEWVHTAAGNMGELNAHRPECRMVAALDTLRQELRQP